MPDTPVEVDVSGIDKILLLHYLWADAPLAPFCRDNEMWFLFDKEAAKEVFAKFDGNFDYFCGRAIKSHLKGDTVCPQRYDRYHGQGAFQMVVTELREDYGISPVIHKTAGRTTEKSDTDDSK